MLIDTTNWTGHNRPDTWERFTWAEAFAQAARSTVKLAMVVRPEMMDPEKFEVTVARNRGLMGNVFDSEKAALAWLLDPYCLMRVDSVPPNPAVELIATGRSFGMRFNWLRASAHVEESFMLDRRLTLTL